ncbi:hypothetical protein [Lactobacillus phage Maenad]|uniref:Uncharacterized protein n=1 Tax=Lactobacillus phage Maenad TaxID=2079431 RepID=A0A2P0ZKR7_9CAUD|nr:hypothetical protein HOS85_gp012 [Lactobacillus phage Maenad]AVH85586.1 hypothetical protein [Lactobacillus phage Maenad]
MTKHDARFIIKPSKETELFKMNERKAIATIGITNTTALLIIDIDQIGIDERVKYCVSTLDEDEAPRNRYGKIHYNHSTGEPYFNSILGRMYLSQAVKVTPFAI